MNSMMCIANYEANKKNVEISCTLSTTAEYWLVNETFSSW